MDCIKQDITQHLVELKKLPKVVKVFTIGSINVSVQKDNIKGIATICTHFKDNNGTYDELHTFYTKTYPIL